MTMDSLFHRLFAAESKLFRLNSALDKDSVRQLSAEEGLRAAQQRQVFGTVFGTVFGSRNGSGSSFTPGTVLVRAVDCGGNPISGASIVARLGITSPGPWVSIGVTDADGYFSYYAENDADGLSAVKAVSTYGESPAIGPTIGYAYDLPLIPTAPYFCLCGRLMQPDTITDCYGTASWTPDSSGLKWTATTTMTGAFKIVNSGAAFAPAYDGSLSADLVWTLFVNNAGTPVVSITPGGAIDQSVLFDPLVPLADDWQGFTDPTNRIGIYYKFFSGYACRGTLSCAGTPPEFNVTGSANGTVSSGPPYNVFVPHQNALNGTSLWTPQTGTNAFGTHGTWAHRLVDATPLTIAKIKFKDYPSP
jgi:hypothetical protein